MEEKTEAYLYNLTKEQVIMIYKLLHVKPENAILTPQHDSTSSKLSKQFHVMRSDFSVMRAGVNGVVQ